MRKFCQILNGIVWWIFEAEEMPEFAPDIFIIDITDIDPQPKEGWGFIDNMGEYSFVEPSIEPMPIVVQPTNAELKETQLITMDALATVFEEMLNLQMMVAELKATQTPGGGA